MFIMSSTTSIYWGLYLDGRGQPRPRGLQIDVAAIVATVLATESPPNWTTSKVSLHDIVRTACAAAITDRHPERHKREWLEDNEELILEQKLDKETAWSAWMAGRVDELTSHIEVEVLDEMDGDIDNDDSEE